MTNHSDSKDIYCSFCEKSRQEVDQIIEGPVRNGSTIYICNECIDVTYNLLHDDSATEAVIKKKEKRLTPEEIKAHLDEYVIGQDNAKIAISVALNNHYKRINNKTSVELDKSNMLMVGPSGTGKTLLVKTVAKLFDLPYVVADATSLTEAGYVGEDVVNLIKRLVDAADGNIEKAEKGIIFIDEIDKKSKRSENASMTRDVSGEGVQQALLKLVEGTVVKIEDEIEETITVDTKDILFIFSGAFVGLDEIVRKNKSKSNIGFGANISKDIPFSESIKDIVPEDFIKYGLIPEFVGRCPIFVLLDDLSIDLMVRILKEPKNNIVSQFQTLFKIEGITLDFDDKYLRSVAEECLRQKVGARGLRTILEKRLQSTQFMLPRLHKEGVVKIVIDDTGNIRHVYKAKKRAKTNE